MFLSYIQDITDMLLAAYDEGMFDNGEYAFITIDTNANEEALVKCAVSYLFPFPSAVLQCKIATKDRNVNAIDSTALQHPQK